MLETEGGLWEFHNKGKWIVIPTNGVINRGGKAVMGKGLAYQAATRFPGLPFELAWKLRRWGNKVFAFPQHRLFTFPTKDNWRDDSSVFLIKQGCRQLAYRVDVSLPKVYLPRLGCGCGNLSWKNEVRPIMKSILDDHFVVVEYIMPF